MLMVTGIAGDYMLDEYGDRDVVFSLIYTNTDNEVSHKPDLFGREIREMWESFIKIMMTDSTHRSLVSGCNQFVLSDIKA